MVFFQSKSLLQAAALPYVWTPRGVEVALITTRERKRWIIPKGWPEKQLSLREVAALEAVEEAGLEGILADKPAGSFVYRKRHDRGYEVPCRVFVFPMLVCHQHLVWKEQDQRKLRWHPIAEAARVADDAGLSKLLNLLAKNPDRLSNLTAA